MWLNNETDGRRYSFPSLIFMLYSYSSLKTQDFTISSATPATIHVFITALITLHCDYLSISFMTPAQQDRIYIFLHVCTCVIKSTKNKCSLNCIWGKHLNRFLLCEMHFLADQENLIWEKFLELWTLIFLENFSYLKYWVWKNIE